eukprot:jgi/Psemu1/306659/fgenesh1_kg.272_\
MTFTFTVPNEYGWVVLGAGVGSYVCNMFLGTAVMKGRSQLNIPYPNLYATPGYHEKADEFNRIQRSHQNFMETLDSYLIMTLLGGLKYPITCAVGTLFYYSGAYFYQKGYIDTSLDVSTARYKKGGAIKYIGVLVSLYSSCSLAYSMITA